MHPRLIGPPLPPWCDVSAPKRGYVHAVTLATQYGRTDEGWWTFHVREYGSLMLDACMDSVAMDAASARMTDWRRRRALVRGTHGS